MAWPRDVPASSFSELRELLLSHHLVLGVAKDHAKDWWTQGEESKGRSIAVVFLLFPIAIGVVVIGAAIWTQNWAWLIALPLGLLTMFFGSPMNPTRIMAVFFGIGCLVAGSLADWSSLVGSGVAVLAIYADMQIYYGLAKRIFRRFLVTDADGFAKYWLAGMVMLREPSGHVHMHDTTEERLRRLDALTSPP